MGKGYLIILMLLLMVVSVIGTANYRFLYNPYTGKLDRTLKLNQSGNNITADYYDGISMFLSDLLNSSRVITTNIQTSLINSSQYFDSSLVLHLQFNNNTLDSSDYRNDGVNNGAILSKGVGEFDGVNTFIDITDSAFDSFGSIDLSYSICEWFKKPIVPSTNRILVGKRGLTDGNMGWRIHIDTSGQYAFFYDGGTPTAAATTTGFSFADNEWHQGCVVVDRILNTSTIFVDNVNYAFADLSSIGEYNTSSADLRIGFTSLGGTITYNGSIDSVKIYNRALPINEIQRIYNEENKNYGHFNKVLANSVNTSEFRARGESHFEDNIHIKDNVKQYFGDADDVSWVFNGSDFVFTGEVGSPFIHLESIGFGGKVGIGTNAAEESLEVVGGWIQTQNDNVGYKMENTGGSEVFKLFNDGTDSAIDLNSGVRDFIFDFNNRGSNFGIGTRTPTYRLEVNGNFSANNTLYVIDGNVGIGTTTPNEKLTVKGNVSLNNTLYVLENGNVGIGTTSPKHLLGVGGMEGIGAPSNLGVKSDSTAWAIRIEENSGVEGWHIGVDADGDLNFDDSNTGIRLTFQDETGNIGIGTQSPGRNVEIFGTSSILRLRDSGLTASATLAYIEFGGTDATAWNRTGYIGDSSSGNADISLRAEVGDLHLGDSSGATVLNLRGGNVGIGNTTPQHKLSVNGDIYTSGNLTLGEKITFRLGAVIDNIKNNVLQVTSDWFNVTGNITAENVFLPQFIFPHTNVTIPIRGANLWTNVSFDQEVTSIKQGIGHTSTDGTNTTFSINADGIYDLSFDFDMIDTSASATDIDMAGRLIYINGTEIDGSLFETDITKQQVETEISHHFMAELKAGDKILFQFIADDGDVELSTHSTFGEHPDGASVVIKKHANIPK